MEDTASPPLSVLSLEAVSGQTGRFSCLPRVQIHQEKVDAARTRGAALRVTPDPLWPDGKQDLVPTATPYPPLDETPPCHTDWACDTETETKGHILIPDRHTPRK